MSDTYYRLNKDVGIAGPYLTDPKTGEPFDNPEKGTPEPLTVAPEFTILVPSQDRTGGVTVKEKRVKPTISATDGRVVHTSDPQVIAGIEQSGLFHQVDAPSTTSKKEG